VTYARTDEFLDVCDKSVVRPLEDKEDRKAFRGREVTSIIAGHGCKGREGVCVGRAWKRST
jgi:hypothetical protein